MSIPSKPKLKHLALSHQIWQRLEFSLVNEIDYNSELHFSQCNELSMNQMNVTIIISHYSSRVKSTFPKVVRTIPPSCRCRQGMRQGPNFNNELFLSAVERRDEDVHRLKITRNNRILPAYYIPLKQSQGWGPTPTPLGITSGFATPPQVHRGLDLEHPTCTHPKPSPLKNRCGDFIRFCN